MDFIRFSIDNPVKVTVAVILLLMAGLLALAATPVQLTPNVDEPVIAVTTNWVGASPQEIEREIIEEQEDKLDSVSGLKQMRSTAYEGQSVITLEFYVGSDMTRALREVSDKLREVPEYPADADEPYIDLSATGGETPIAWLIATSKTAGFDIESVKDLAEDRIKPFLEQIDGVSEVRVFGGRERQVHVRINPQRMAERGVTFDELRGALRAANVNISAGALAEGRLEVRVRAVGEFDDLDKVRRTIVKQTPAGPVRVEDLATVALTLEKRRGFVRSRGEVALAIPVYREPGTNVMTIMAELRRRVREADERIMPGIARRAASDFSLAAAPELRLEQVYDETLYIEDSIALVRDNLWQAAALTGLVLMMFLRTIRSTLIIMAAIPISVIGTFVFMAGAGRSVNVISLAGLAFAVGMVVDNAIVVLENTDRHLAMGKRPARAAYDAAREVWGAILASTLTTVVVFIPVLQMREEAGQLFRDIALAVCASVSLSLLVSVTAIPAASAKLLRDRSGKSSPVLNAARGLFGLAAAAGALNTAFARALGWMIRPSPFTFALRAAVVAAATVFALGAAVSLMPKTTYLPAGNRNLVFGFVVTPPAYTVEQNRFIGERIESTVSPFFHAKSYDEVAALPPVISYTGKPIANIPPIENFFFVSIGQGMFTGAISRDKENVQPLAELLTTSMSSIPGSFGGAFQTSVFSRGLGGNNRIDVQFTGYDLDAISKAASSLFMRLMALPEYGPRAVRPSPLNFNLPGPELRVELDRVRAAELGIDQSSLALATQALVDGSIVGDYRLAGDTLDLLIVRDPELPLTVDTLGETPLAGYDALGQPRVVPLSAVAHLVPSDAPQTINRIDKQRSVTLEITAPDSIPLQQAQEQIDALIAELRGSGEVSPDVAVVQAGTADKLTQVRQAMLGSWHGWNLESLRSLAVSRLFLALVVTYLVMAALFESWVYPMVILFSVPLAAVGGFMGLAIAHHYYPGQQFDVVAMLGFVILIGIVVNNAILLVHQSLNFMKGLGESADDVIEAMPPALAIETSVRTRVRPILMTTITSLAGMLPLVVAPGSGSELYRGLGAVVLGGLAVSTIFTLLIVPMVFSLFIDTGRAWNRWTGAQTLPKTPTQGGRGIEPTPSQPAASSAG